MVRWLWLAVIIAAPTYALSDGERQYLTQVLNQLHSLPPLIIEAQRHQVAHQRIPFHYQHFTDAKGQSHNGLLDDVQAISDGVKAALNDTPSEPQVLEPLQGDYLDHA